MAGLFVFSAAQLNPICFYLSFPTLAILLLLFVYEAVHIPESSLSRSRHRPRSTGGMACRAGRVWLASGSAECSRDVLGSGL